MATPFKRKSSTWNHFLIKRDDDTKATCLHCNVSVSRGSKAVSSKGFTTSNMWTHVKRYHEPELKNDTPSTSNTEAGPPNKKQATMEQILDKNVMYDTDDPRAKAITQTIAEQICVDMEPFDIVNKQGHLLSRENKIKELLEELPHIIVTTDLWTSDASSIVNDFISLTAHGVNNNFELKNYCLAVFPFEGERHSGENIAENLRELFKNWGIDEQVRAVVTDNAPNMGLAVTQVGVKRIRCMAHSLQLVLKDAFSGEEKINEMITKARSIIGHFSHSTLGHKILTEMQKSHNIPCHVLIQDVSTRWDSTLHALRRLLEQRVAVQASLPHVKCRTELVTEEWILMEQVVSVLSYFEEATKSISQESSCLSDAIPLINSLRKVLERIKNTSAMDDNAHSPEYNAFVLNLIAGINDRFDCLESDETFILATALDPRYKLRTFTLQSTIMNARRKLISLITNDTYRESPNSAEAPRQNQNEMFSGIWSVCHSLIKEAEDDEPLSNMSIQPEQEEVESYLRFQNISIKQDPKIYWRQEDKYPKLKKLAQNYLSYPMSSVASERLFSTAGLIQNDLRNRLSADNLNKLCFLNKNLPKVGFNY
ncbi:unnamed protein product [Colias eurytheme]|nr:unnamed protein product [Colias eurytheme]